jgi:hypothetical protein
MTTTAAYCGTNKFSGISELLFANNTIGPFGQGGFNMANDDFVVFKHNRFGPNNTEMRFPARVYVMNANEGGTARAVYDNVMVKGTCRLAQLDYKGQFGEYIGFNFWEDQTALPPETGDYCATQQGVYMPGTGSCPQDQSAMKNVDPNFPYYCYLAPRGVFLTHESNSSNPNGFLIESNDFQVEVAQDYTVGSTTVGQYATFFRNRSVSNLFNKGRIDMATDGDTTEDSNSWFANRWRTWLWSGSGNHNRAFGRWNVGVSTMSTPSGTGVDWDGTNQQTSGASSNCPLALPASLAFRTDTPPAWWCQESGSWTAWAMGACDGASPPKLPAQIRSEGGTCTPPDGGGGGSTALLPPTLIDALPKP